jgi:hypothetical protein
MASGPSIRTTKELLMGNARTRTVTAAAAVALLVAGAGLTLRWDGHPTGIAEDEEPPRLDSASVAAVVRATSVGEEQTGLVGAIGWRFAVSPRGVLYERADYPVAGMDVTESVAAPGPRDEFPAATWSTIRFVEEVDYILVLEERYGRAADRLSKEWFVRLAIEERTGRAAEGTPPSLVNDLAAIAATNVNTTDALLALAGDLEQFGRDRAEVERRHRSRSTESEIVAFHGELRAVRPGPTLEVLQRSHALTQSDLLKPFEVWKNLADTDRQLPSADDELEAIPVPIREEVGADDWVFWVIHVTYDEATTRDVEWLGVYFPGHGILGPEATNEQGLASIIGYGPADVEPMLLTWGYGYPEELTAGSQGSITLGKGEHLVRATRLALPIDSPVADRYGVPSDGALQVIVEGGEPVAVNLLDSAQQRQLFEDYEPRLQVGDLAEDS